MAGYFYRITSNRNFYPLKYNQLVSAQDSREKLCQNLQNTNLPELHLQKLNLKELNSLYERYKANYSCIKLPELGALWKVSQSSIFSILDINTPTLLNFLFCLESFFKYKATNPNSSVKKLHYVAIIEAPLLATTIQEILSLYAQKYSNLLTKAVQEQLINLFTELNYNCCRTLETADFILDLHFATLTDTILSYKESFNNYFLAVFIDNYQDIALLGLSSVDKQTESNQMDNNQYYNHHLNQNNSHKTNKKSAHNPEENNFLVNSSFELLQSFIKQQGKLFIICSITNNLSVKPNYESLFSNESWSFTKKKTSANLDYLIAIKLIKHSIVPYPCFLDKYNLISDSSITIVGAGIVGLTLAKEFIEQGFKVRLIDEKGIAQGASGNPYGLVYPQIFDDDKNVIDFYLQAYTYANAYYKKELADYYQEKQIKILFKKDFKLPLGLDFLTEKFQITPYPALNLQQLSFSGACLAVKDSMEKSYADLEQSDKFSFLKQKVEKISCNENQQWQLSVMNGEVIQTDLLILANSHAVVDFFPDLNIYPVRGQLSVFKDKTKALDLINAKSNTDSNADNNIDNRSLCHLGYSICYQHEQEHYLLVGATHNRGDIDTSLRAGDDIINLENYKVLVQDCTLAISDLAFSRCAIRSAFRDRMPVASAISNYEALEYNYHNLYELLRRKQEDKILPSASLKNLIIVAGLGSRGLTSAPFLAKIMFRKACGMANIASDSLLHKLHADRYFLNKFAKGNFKKKKG